MSRARWVTEISRKDGEPLVCPASVAGLRVAEMLDWVFKGLHHVDREVARADFTGKWVRITTRRHDFATWDSNYLTRLVVAAHEWGIRVEMRAVAPGCMEIDLHPRVRCGTTPERHPTLEGHLTHLNRSATDDRV